MNEYSLFETNTTTNDDNDVNNNNSNENYDVGTVDLQSSISVDFDISGANENTNIENIIETSNLINALNNVQPYNSVRNSYYQPNCQSNANLINTCDQNVYNVQLNLDSLDQCIQNQGDAFKFATVSYSAQPISASWRNAPTYTIPANFDETTPLEGDLDLQSNQNQESNNYYCMSNNFNSG